MISQINKKKVTKEELLKKLNQVIREINGLELYITNLDEEDDEE